MAWRWALRHRRRPAGPIEAVAAARGLDAEERASYDRVAAVLRDTGRASSAVEGLNSILRMHQARHRRMTRPMLDLKRLYWNTHRFRAGPRKGTCPYRALGLGLPSFDFWTILPAPYPIPDDGPVGQMLKATGRHPMRAPHLHFMIAAPGRHTLVTQLFVEGGDYLDADTVFGVKPPIIVPFTPQEGPAPGGAPAAAGASGWRRVTFTFQLAEHP